MREYNYLQAIYMSFYSRNLYRDVANNWNGGVVLYLFFVLAICWSVMMFKYQPAINIAATQFANKYVMQMPEMVVKDGQLSTPENRPYLITDRDTNKVIVVIDESGQYRDLESTPVNTRILITKNMVSYYNSNNSLKVQKIPQNVNANFKPDQIKNLIEKFAGWLWMIILPVFLLFSFVYRLVQALVYAIVGKIFSAMLGAPLSYAKILKLTMIAVTPAIIIGDILTWCGVMFKFEWLLLFFIAMAYLIFAIKANRQMAIIVR